MAAALRRARPAAQYQPMLDAFIDPRFVPVVVITSAVSLGAFLLFALPLTALAVADPARLRHRRIQARRVRPGVFWPSLRACLANNAWMLLAATAAWPLLQFSGLHLGPLPPLYLIAAQLLLFVYLDDLLYYGFHRLMHRPFWFRRVHGRHHRVHTPWAITGLYMHPLEYVATGTIALIGPVLVEAHVVTLWLWTAFRQWEAAEGHCGYRLPFSPSGWLPFSHAAVHHDFHHARVRGNYAGFLALWDRVLGTEARDYRADRERLLARERSA